MEPDHVANADDMADKTAGYFAVFDTESIINKVHRGL